jgi:type III secretory pathway component EscT
VTVVPLAPEALIAPLLHALRLLPVAVLSPFLGGPLAPAPLRLLLAVGMGTAAWLLAGARPIAAEGTALAALALRELALGSGLAVVVAAPLEAARAAGRLADMARGATLAELHVAPLRQRETALGDLLVQQLIVLAALGGGLGLVIRGLLSSFAALPAGAPFAAMPVAELALRASSMALTAAVAVAAPAVAGVLAAELVVAAVLRVAPGLQLPELTQPARAWLGLLAMALAASAGAGRLMEQVGLAGDLPARLLGVAPAGWTP